jgi:hypothetical protein
MFLEEAERLAGGVTYIRSRHALDVRSCEVNGFRIY